MATDMGNFENAPKIWDSLLGIVGEHWLPLVAGGCIRDFLIEQPAKDVDIFVPATSDEDFLSIIATLPAGVCEGEIIYLSEAFVSDEAGFNIACKVEYAEDAAAPDLVGVWEGEIMGVPCNIIGRECMSASDRFVDQAQALLATFDFDTVQGAYCAQTWHILSGCKLANRSKVATLLHNRSYDQSLKRFARFNARHGDSWALLDPYTRTL